MLLHLYMYYMPRPSFYVGAGDLNLRPWGSGSRLFTYWAISLTHKYSLLHFLETHSQHPTFLPFFLPNKIQWLSKTSPGRAEVGFDKQRVLIGWIFKNKGSVSNEVFIPPASGYSSRSFYDLEVETCNESKKHHAAIHTWVLTASNSWKSKEQHCLGIRKSTLSH